MYACQLLSCILLLVLIKSVFVGPPSRITMNWCKYIHSEIIWNIKLHFVMIMISRGLKCVPYLKLLELHKCHFLYNDKHIHSKAPILLYFVGPKRRSGNCYVSCFLTDKTALVTFKKKCPKCCKSRKCKKSPNLEKYSEMY